MIDLFFIKTFVSVAKTQSFRIAAQRNFITQPAVSQHVKKLEQKLNCTLFERRGKKVYLTTSGETFLSYAENILRMYETALLHIDSINNRINGTIRIATIYSIGLHELKPLVQYVMSKWPQLNIQLSYHQSHEIYELIDQRQIDFGLVAYPQKSASIVTETVAQDELILIEPTNKPIFKQSTVNIKALHQNPFIALSSLTPTGEFIDTTLRRKHVFPNIVQDYDNIEMIKNAVIMGLGCALLPSNTVRRELKDKSVKQIKVTGLSLKRPLAILYAKGKIFTKSTEVFHKTLVSRLKNFTH